MSGHPKRSVFDSPWSQKTDAMKKYLFAVLFCLSLCSAYCQISEVERCDDLDLLTVAEKKLLPVLDAVLAEERTRDYYRSDTKFSISFQADSTIRIEAFDLLFLSLRNRFGGLLRRDRVRRSFFFVAGAYLDERIFHRSGAKRRFRFYTDSAYEENGKTVLLLFQDDSHSQWIYRYDGDEFRLLDFVDTAPDE